MYDDDDGDDEHDDGDDDNGDDNGDDDDEDSDGANSAQKSRPAAAATSCWTSSAFAQDAAQRVPTLTLARVRPCSHSGPPVRSARVGVVAPPRHPS